MKNIFIRNVKDEIITFIDRKANELSTTSKRRITRNEYIHLILEKQLRDDLSVDENKYNIINTKIDLLVTAIDEDKKATSQLIELMTGAD